MRSTAFASVTLFLTCSAAVAAEYRTATEMSASAFLSHVDYLASDALRGRGVGDEGIEKAARYIAEQFESCGLKPGGEDGTFFQRFEVKLRPELTDDGFFKVAGVEAKCDRDEEYVPFQFSSDDTFSADVVFAGYGIINEEKNYNDFAHFDVEGKVVLIFRREPPGWADGEDNFTQHAQFQNKVYTVKDAKGAAVLIVDQKPEGDDEPRLTRWGRGGTGGADYGLPAFHVSRDFAQKLVEAGGLGSLDSLQEKVDKGEFASAALKGVRVEGRAGVKRSTTTTPNVIGILPGKGPKADEYLVIGGHYDHLGEIVPGRGFGRSERTEEPEPQIHNGADDNASGTAGVIELAKYFAKRTDLNRGIAFIAFSGEEIGLLGSKHYVDNPTVPFEKIVAMINLDMIGRLPADSNEVQVFGTKAAEEFDAPLTRIAESRGLVLKGSASAIGPSDHASFYRKKIPALHFFTGLHSDYHRPGDDTDKVNAEGAMAVLGMVQDMAVEIANAESRPTYHEVKERADVGRGGYRVRMGIYPSYADNDKGMQVEGVVEDGPAMKSGMKAEDIITRIGETQVRNINDYMGALRNNKPGDEVEVVVIRDGAELTLKVKLEGN